MVRKKLHPWAPPLTESLSPALVTEIIHVLFPSRGEHMPPAMAPPNWESSADSNSSDVPGVTQEELGAAVHRLRAKNTAPGPDGIPGRAWVLSYDALESRLLGLFTTCLKQGQFPQKWKTGKLVLLKKEGRPADSPSAYRPIVLLDEVGKLFERVIATRLVQHLSGEGPDVADVQFGFRQGRSTIDAIMRVKSQAEEAVSRGEVLLAVSLDIANAFNSMPWSCIREALRYHGVPIYLRRIVGAYLSDRAVIFPGQNNWGRREMSCGVPQGSVLGPILWNIGYDWALRGVLLHGVSVTCYADDTLIVARGRTYSEAAIQATAGVAQVVYRIRRLGLEVALHKSEAVVFHGPRRKPPAGSSITVGGVRIDVKPTMKYLGLVLDSRWDFIAHFQQSAPRLKRAAGALSRLLPNIGGPNVLCRKLFEGVVRSIALYGAPVWAGALTARNVATLRQTQRILAIRAARGYRTISFEASSLLAGSLPWDLEARTLASLYVWRKEKEASSGRPAPREVKGRRDELRQVHVAEWANRLNNPSAGLALIEAVRPIMSEWLNRRHGTLTFRLTQVLSGHGCFGRYLCRIRREQTSGCHHCVGGDEDTVLHTLQVCPAWDEQRCDLIAAIGADLSLPVVVKAMVGSADAWNAAVSFCETVMSVKEAAERDREQTSTLSPRQNRRRRRRVMNDDLQPP